MHLTDSAAILNLLRLFLAWAPISQCFVDNLALCARALAAARPRSVLASPHETLWRRSRALPASFLALFASGCLHHVAQPDPDRQWVVALEAQTFKPLRTALGVLKFQGTSHP